MIILMDLIRLLIALFLSDTAAPARKEEKTKFDLLSCLFHCLGKLAQSDDVTSEGEIEFISYVVNEFYPDEKKKHKNLIKTFQAGGETSSSFDEMMNSLVKTLAVYPAENQKELRGDIMIIFCQLAQADELIDDSEIKLLECAAKHLGAEAQQELRAFLREYEQDKKQKQTEEMRLELYPKLFRCLGKLAKCDGRVSEEEAQIISETLSEDYPNDRTQRRQMIEYFNSGRDSLFSFEDLTDELAAMLGKYNDTAEFRKYAMNFLCKIAQSNRRIDMPELKNLDYAARTMGKEAMTEYQKFINKHIEIVLYPPLFRCLGKLAKCDGRVSEEEAGFISDTLHKNFPLDRNMRGEMAEQFNSGRDSARSFEELADELASHLDYYDAPEKFRTNAMQYLCQIANASNSISPLELKKLEYAAGKLGRAAKIKLEDFLNGQYQQHQQEDQRQQEDYRSSDARQPDHLTECYKILDIPPTASDAEVKKAFRRKAQACHPDKVQGTGLDPEFMKFAKEKFQQISNAYDAICKARNMR